MNQRVHWCIRGCLTLKFSGSWKTVTSSLSLNFFAPPGAVFSSVPLPSTGEMGMVSRGTGDWGFAAAMMMFVSRRYGDTKTWKESLRSVTEALRAVLFQ